MNNPKYRHDLPQLRGVPLLTDSGLETSLIFHEGLDLPHFAAFDLLRTQIGCAHLKRYYTRHADLAKQHQTGFILDTPTWRASSDWGDLLGYSEPALNEINRAAVELVTAIQNDYDTSDTPFVVSGNIGPRGDGYDPALLMSAKVAEQYHSNQINVLVDAGVDMITALTMTHAGEAIGITRAAARVEVPVVISFTAETDGRLPAGQLLGEAIEEVDAQTGSAPAYYMINCAHPDHFRNGIAESSSWTGRVRGIRANASRQSHAELDACTVLDSGDAIELGNDYAAMMALLPELNVFGGCCGTDHRHIDEIASLCLPKIGLHA